MSRVLLIAGTQSNVGKTTAALGLGFRAIGDGLKVLMIQFLKSAHTSELESAKVFGDSFEIRRLAVHKKFFWQLSEEEKADLVTEMKKVKHYYEQGVQSRKGIEF